MQTRHTVNDGQPKRHRVTDETTTEDHLTSLYTRDSFRNTSDSMISQELWTTSKFRERQEEYETSKIAHVKYGPYVLCFLNMSGLEM